YPLVPPSSVLSILLFLTDPPTSDIYTLSLHDALPILVASLREPIIDTLRQQPVNGFQDALNYCGTLDYLNARDRLHERLQAHGVPVLEALPHEIGPQLIGRYLAWKRGGVI